MNVQRTRGSTPEDYDDVCDAATSGYNSPAGDSATSSPADSGDATSSDDDSQGDPVAPLKKALRGLRPPPLLSTYRGVSDDLDEWIYKFKQQRRAQGWDAIDAFNWMTCHLAGPALRRVRTASYITTPRDVEALLRKHFAPTRTTDDINNELFGIRQASDERVTTYTARFNTLLFELQRHDAITPGETTIKSTYTRCLRSKIKFWLKFHTSRKDSLEQLKHRARKAEMDANDCDDAHSTVPEVWRSQTTHATAANYTRTD